jgi:purine-binding chemotaxis protein CheW
MVALHLVSCIMMQDTKCRIQSVYILRRVKTMPDEKSTTDSKNSLQTYIQFKLGKNDFAMPVNYVKEVLRIVEISRIPEMPVSVEGFINFRGVVIPIIDLKKRLRLGRTEKTVKTRILIIKTADILAGFLADLVVQVFKLPEKEVFHPSKKSIGIDLRFVKGIGKLEDKLITILEAENIFTSMEINLIEESKTFVSL